MSESSADTELLPEALLEEFFAQADRLKNKVKNDGLQDIESAIAILDGISNSFRATEKSFATIANATSKHMTELIKADRSNSQEMAESSMQALANVIDKELPILVQHFHGIRNNADWLLNWFRQPDNRTQKLDNFIDMLEKVVEPFRRLIDANIGARNVTNKYLTVIKSGRRRKQALIEAYDNLINIYQQIYEYLSSEVQSRMVTITLIDKDSNEEHPFTPQYLADEVAPFIYAFTEIIRIFRQANSSQPVNPLKIVTISHNSPPSVSLVGNVDGAVIEKTREIISKEWKELALKEKNLEIQEKELLLEKYRAEIVAQRMQKNIERQKSNEESELHLLEIEKRQLENVQLRLDIEKAEIEIQMAALKEALNMMKEHFPNISDEEKLNYAFQLIKPIKTIASSSLRIAPLNDEQTN